MSTARKQQALQFYIAQGWTPEQSAGIVANLVAESGLRPDAVGDGGLAYGLPQWHQPRPRRGESILGSTFEQQLQYVDDELRARSGATDESKAAFLLAQCDTPESAAATFCRHYERPADIPGDSAKRAALAETIFTDFGGTLSPNAPEAPLPTQQPVATPERAATQPEKTMAPLLFLPAILEMIPSLMGIFGKGEKAAQNAQAAQIVVNAFKAAVPGALNEQDAIQKVQADPALKAQVKATVMADPNVLGLVEVGGGVAAARTANLALVQGATKWWQLVLNPVFLVTMLTLPLVYLFVWKLVGFLDKVSSDVISQTMGTVIGLVLGSVMGYFFGQTYQSGAKRQGDTQQ